MIQRITVRDENGLKIGLTFPRRAKQLVIKQKASWSDETHSEIILTSKQIGGIKVNKEISDWADELFDHAPKSDDSSDVKKAFIVNSNKQYEALVADGMDKGKAVEKIIDDAGDSDRDKVIKSLTREKSIVRDAYRDDAYTVLHSTPLEIIKKSKKRTRELHTAFSLVLWSGTMILYLGLSFLLGYRTFTLNPSKLSWTWLVFIFAALIECAVEIYFCKKELDVLNENIDLRQINPSKDGDFNLISYQKKLMTKIKSMSSALLWLPLVIIYFVCGYMFNLWHIAWIVFIFGAFLKLIQNFVKTLKKQAD